MKNVTVPTNPNATAVQNAFAALLPYVAQKKGFEMRTIETETENMVQITTQNYVLMPLHIPQLDGFHCFVVSENDKNKPRFLIIQYEQIRP